MILLIAILMTGPLILGATQLWVELPLLFWVALLLTVQGFRLTVKPSGESFRRIDAIDLIVGSFALYAMARWFTSPLEYFSRIEVMEIVSYAGIFYTCRYGIGSRRYCVILIYFLVVLGIFEMILGWYFNWQTYLNPPGLNADVLAQTTRWTGTYESPNHYVSLLIMAVGASLALGGLSSLPPAARVIFFVAAGVMIVGAISSGSRGGYIALLASTAGIVVMATRNGKTPWWLLALGAVFPVAIIISLSLLSPLVQARMSQTLNALTVGRLTDEPRVELNLDAIRIARDYPIFGTGPGTFPYIYPRYRSSRFDWMPERAHDDYLNCLDDYGLVGFAIVMFFIVAVSFKFVRPIEAKSRWYDRVLIASGFASWLAILTHSLVDYNLHVPANALLFFSLIGLAMGCCNNDHNWSKLSLEPLGSWLGWSVVVLSIGYGLEISRTALSDIAYEQVLSSVDEVSYAESIVADERALSYDAGNEPAWELLGDLHRSHAALIQPGRVAFSEDLQALGAYRRALEANPFDDSIHSRIGMTLDLMQKYPEALSEHLTATRAQPHSGEFWYHLLYHYELVGDAKGAGAAFDQMSKCFRPPEWDSQAADTFNRFVNGRGDAARTSNPAPQEQ